MDVLIHQESSNNLCVSYQTIFNENQSFHQCPCPCPARNNSSETYGQSLSRQFSSHRLYQKRIDDRHHLNDWLIRENPSFDAIKISSISSSITSFQSKKFIPVSPDRSVMTDIIEITSMNKRNSQQQMIPSAMDSSDQSRLNNNNNNTFTLNSWTKTLFYKYFGHSNLPSQSDLSEAVAILLITGLFPLKSESSENTIRSFRSPPLAIESISSHHHSYTVSPSPYYSSSKNEPDLISYIYTVIQKTQISFKTIVLGLYYLFQLRQILNLRSEKLSMLTLDSICPSLYSLERLFLSSVILASKFLYDDTYSNEIWSSVSSNLLSRDQVNGIERDLLSVLNYHLWPKNERFFQQLGESLLQTILIRKKEICNSIFHCQEALLSSHQSYRSSFPSATHSSLSSDEKMSEKQKQKHFKERSLHIQGQGLKNSHPKLVLRKSSVSNKILYSSKWKNAFLPHSGRSHQPLATMSCLRLNILQQCSSSGNLDGFPSSSSSLTSIGKFWSFSSPMFLSSSSCSNRLKHVRNHG